MMFIIRSNRTLDGHIENFSDGRGFSGSCIFPTREMAENVLQSILKYHHESENNIFSFHIKEVPDDYFYQKFLEIPENKHFRRDFKINQINE